jgi:hypothetical protein
MNLPKLATMAATTAGHEPSSNPAQPTEIGRLTPATSPRPPATTAWPPPARREPFAEQQDGKLAEKGRRRPNSVCPPRYSNEYSSRKLGSCHTMSPLALSDEQRTRIISSADTLPMRWRSRFLSSVQDLLLPNPAPTDADVIRACAAAKRAIVVGISTPSID